MGISIIPFIFNWKNQFGKAKQTEDLLRAIFGKVFVINSDPDNSREGWIDLGENAFFTAQFFKALELFDGDILFHVQADATYFDWPAVFDNALRYFQKYKWGVFAPNVDFTYWESTRVNIESRFLKEPELSIVSCTDCTCWFIHKDIIKSFKARDHLFKDNKFGWGIDLTVAALSYYHKRPVIRDYDHTITHPPGRGYSNQAATIEYNTFLGELDEELKPVLKAILTERQALLEFLD